MKYTLRISGKKSGPFTEGQINEMFLEGKISQDDGCRPEGGGLFFSLKSQFPKIVSGRAKKGDLDEPYSSLMLTTETNPQGLTVEERLEVITAECAFGMNIFRDFFAGMRDFFGGRSKATQRILRDGRKSVLNELKKEAFECGGNAVIGVRMDYSQFSGHGKSMLFVVASGTAVKLSTEQGQ